MYRITAGLLGVSLLLCVGTVPAKADLKLCNNTDSKVGIAIGYKDKEGWASEGWWTAEPKANAPKNCLTLLKGNLISRYYYVYATDYGDKGGSWGGKSNLCTRDKIFTIRGFDKCEERGYIKKGFREVDTGDASDWTISLSGEKTTQGN
jgi:uncharacterized membrane protein